MEDFNELFRVVQNPDNEKYVILVGNQLVTNKKFDTEEDAITYLEEKPYEIIMNLMAIVIKFELLHHNNSNYIAGKFPKTNNLKEKTQAN